MFRYLFVFIRIMAILSEPECSRFHYEEQTLNKMIRQEIAMEKLRSDMVETQQQVREAVSELKETTQQLRSDFDKEKTNLRSVVEETEGKTDESILKYSSAMEKLKGPSIVFRSKDVTDLTPITGETFVFMTTTLNQGLGYDNTTGVFTAPVAGIYMFSVQLCAKMKAFVVYSIVSDDVEIKKGLFADFTYNRCYTTDTFARLKKGSTVLVKCSYRNCPLHASSHGWNSFSGALMHA